MDSIRVFVVDDHPMIRLGLQAMLKGERGINWVGDAEDGEQALHLAPVLAPDLLLVDLVMPRLDGVQTISALKPLLPKAHFVVLSSQSDPVQTRRALAAGASGFLLKNASSQELLTVIRTTLHGQRVLAPEVADALMSSKPSRLPGGDLTPRERELLTLMARGMSNQDIAQALSIALPTVKFHVTNVLAKLHAENRTEAVLTAIRHRLATLE